MVKLVDVWEDLNQDKNFAYRSTSDSLSDLIKDMNENGLIVSAVDMSGDMVRVPVRGRANARPDKGREASGWYAIYDHGDCFFATYGNWRTNETFKFSSVQFEALSTTDQLAIREKVEEQQRTEREARERHQDEVAAVSQAQWEGLTLGDLKPEDHGYTRDKQIGFHGVKIHNGQIVVPLYSAKNLKPTIRSLQFISTKGEKRFKSGGQTSPCYFPLGFATHEIAYLDTIIVTEGYATACSCYAATQLPTISIFSANNGVKALSELRKLTRARFVIAFDNDENGVGAKRANEVISAINNCTSKIPRMRGDYNDLMVEHSLDAVRAALLTPDEFDLTKRSIRNFDTKPPPREWLVENLFEHKKNGLLASVGGVGKSYLMLQLCHEVTKRNGRFLGHEVKTPGNAVYLTAEDSEDELRRRIHTLDPDNKRKDSLYDVFVLPIPDLGRPLSIVSSNSDAGLHITKDGYDFMDSLNQIPILSLVCIDPVQSFVTGELNSQEVGQLYSQFCQMIATKHDCSIISVHHMNKTGLVGIDDPLEARAAIRGASALVDASRYVMALFLTGEEDARQICLANGLDYDRLRVIRAAVVKANSDADMTVKTLVRRNAVLELIDNNSTTIKWA